MKESFQNNHLSLYQSKLSQIGKSPGDCNFQLAWSMRDSSKDSSNDKLAKTPIEKKDQQSTSFEIMSRKQQEDQEAGVLSRKDTDSGHIEQDLLNIANQRQVREFDSSQKGVLKEQKSIEYLQKEGEDAIEIEIIEEEGNQKEINSQQISNKKATNKIKDESKKKLRHGFTSMTSSILDDNYFKEDSSFSENLMKKRGEADVTKLKDYFMKFRFGQFLETLFIHFAYFIFLGPLMVPLLRLRGKHLPENMMFYGWNKSVLSQFLVFCGNFGCLFFYFYFKNTYIKGDIEIMNNISSVMFRCVIIACKYATFDPAKIKIYRTTRIPFEQITSECYLNWVKQNTKIISNQVYYAQRSFDIDPGLSFIQFILKPDASTHDKLKKCEQEIDLLIIFDKICKKPIPLAKLTENDEFYCSFAIIKFMIDNFERKTANSIKWAFRIINLYIFVRSFIPIFYNFYTYGRDAYGVWYEYFIGFSSAFQLASLYYTGSKIMFYGLIDIRRKVKYISHLVKINLINDQLYMMRQVTFMISPRKIRGFDLKKLFPTINIFRSMSLKAWSLLRLVTMEYGKPYLLRIQGFYFFLGIWVVINLTQIVLDQYKLFPLNFAQKVQTYLDTSFVLSLVFSMVVAGSQINDLFELQESILNSNKTIVSDLLLVSKKYISKKIRSTSFIYNKAIEKVLEVTDDYQNYIEDLVDQYDYHIDELKFDNENNAFTLFGLKVTFVLLQSVVIAVGSVIVSLVSSVFSDDNSSK